MSAQQSASGQSADEVGNAFPFLAPGAYDAVVNGVVIPFSVTPDAADVADLFGGVWYEI